MRRLAHISELSISFQGTSDCQMYQNLARHLDVEEFIHPSSKYTFKCPCTLEHRNVLEERANRKSLSSQLTTAKSEIAKVIHGSSLLIGDLRMREPVTFRYLCPLESALPLVKPRLCVVVENKCLYAQSPQELRNFVYLKFCTSIPQQYLIGLVHLVLQE